MQMMIQEGIDDGDFYNVNLNVKYHNVGINLTSDIEYREQMNEFVKIRKDYMAEKGIQTIEQLNIHLMTEDDSAGEDRMELIRQIREKERETRLISCSKSISTIANTIAMFLKRIELTDTDPKDVKCEIIFNKSDNDIIYPVIKDISTVNVFEAPLRKDLGSCEIYSKPTSEDDADTFFDRSDPDKFDENGDYKFTRNDVKIICDKLYRDELLKAFNVDTIFKIAPRMRGTIRKMIKNKKFHSALYETKLILMDVGTEEYKDEETGDVASPDELIFYTLFNSQLFYMTHKCICEMLTTGTVTAELLSDLKSNMVDILRKKNPEKDKEKEKENK